MTSDSNQNRRGVQQFIAAVRQRRWANLFVVNLRIVIGFAFLPAGLKKVLGQPFTDPDSVGVFHDFLHTFLATGPFYRFVGVVQLVAAIMLMTQRFAALGAAIMFPVVTAITVFCWSTAKIPTITTVTLMTLGIAGLLLWDIQKWRALVLSDYQAADVRVTAVAPVIDAALWQRCGVAIVCVYATATILHGGVYRPKGLDLSTPAFYLLPLIAVFPVVTWLIDRRRYRRQQPGTTAR